MEVRDLIDGKVEHVPVEIYESPNSDKVGPECFRNLLRYVHSDPGDKPANESREWLVAIT